MFFKNFFINLQTEIYSWNNIMRRLALKTEKKTRKVFFFFFFSLYFAAVYYSFGRWIFYVKRSSANKYLILL